MAFSERVLRAVEAPETHEAAAMIHVATNSTDVTSCSALPPTISAMSAMEWHLGCRFRKLPWTTPTYVLRAPQPTTLRAPGAAPREYMAEGIVMTPVAKTTES